MKKIFIVFICLVTLVLYQEISSKDSYLFSSLWNVKTRAKVFSKDDKEVHLIGMIHVGNSSYYKNMLKDYEKLEGSVVTLTEGVKEKEVKDRLSSFSYESLAKIAGLVSQKKYYSFPNMVNADVYIEDLDPTVQKHMEEMNTVLGLVVGFVEGTKTVKETSELLKQTTPMNQNVFNNEIILKRNDVLWSSITENLDKHEKVIVPWGAAHHEDMEKRLLSLGFKETSSQTYRALNLVSVLGYVSYYVVKALLQAPL